MTEVINELQKQQSIAIEHGMSFSLDVISTSDEIKALVTVRSSTSNGYADDQRYMKTTISSDDEIDFVQTKINNISEFISQVIVSANYNTKE